VLRRYRGDPLTPMMLGMFLGGVAIYAFATTIFGDGLNEAGRHYLVGSLAMYTMVIAGLGGLGTLAVRWKADAEGDEARGPRRRRHARLRRLRGRDRAAMIPST
jgi:hypothetical protein